MFNWATYLVGSGYKAAGECSYLLKFRAEIAEIGFTSE